MSGDLAQGIYGVYTMRAGGSEDVRRGECDERDTE